MIEKILIILLPLIFLGTFITRNIIVKARTKQMIKASDPIITSTIILTNLCIFTAIISTYSNYCYNYMGIIHFLRFPLISYVGLCLFAIGIILGYFFSSQLKDSWRIGIHKDQKIELIQNGIYGYIRNPYFLTYYIIFFSLFLFRPSLILVVLIIVTIAVYHRMVLKEESYLLSIHGEKYKSYKRRTGRYFPHIFKN